MASSAPRRGPDRGPGHPVTRHGAEGDLEIVVCRSFDEHGIEVGLIEQWPELSVDLHLRVTRWDYVSDNSPNADVAGAADICENALAVSGGSAAASAGAPNPPVSGRTSARVTRSRRHAKTKRGRARRPTEVRYASRQSHGLPARTDETQRELLRRARSRQR